MLCQECFYYAFNFAGIPFSQAEERKAKRVFVKITTGNLQVACCFDVE